MFHLMFSLPWLIVATRFIAPLPWPWMVKLLLAAFLFLASQYHLFSRFTSGSVFAPEFPRPLLEALRQQHPALPVVVLTGARHPGLLDGLLRDGVPVEYPRPDGSIAGDHVRLVDFNDVQANDWLAVNQFTVIEGQHNRRPDIVVFINGLPLAILELKNPADEKATIWSAHAQLQTYKAQIPSLFRANGVLVTTDGVKARIGSLTADLERFMPWRTVDGEDFAHRGTPELETLLRGVFTRANLLALIDALNKAKPATSKGVYLRKVAVSSTMGVGVRVDMQSISA